VAAALEQAGLEVIIVTLSVDSSTEESNDGRLIKRSTVQGRQNPKWVQNYFACPAVPYALT
jgi:hypothetical protein